MAEVNLYGRKVDLKPLWFLTQGYCQATAADGVKKAEEGTYSPEAGEAWMKSHIPSCRQCLMANAVKASVIEFLERFHPDLITPYKQGYNPGKVVVVGWLEYIRLKHPAVLRWFATEGMMLIGPHAAEFERVYGGKEA